MEMFNNKIDDAFYRNKREFEKSKNQDDPFLYSSDEEYEEEYVDKLMRKAKGTIKCRHAIIKVKLMSTFDISEQEVTAEFINKYYKPVYITGYSTRKKIIKYGSIEKYNGIVQSKHDASIMNDRSVQNLYMNTVRIDKFMVLMISDIMIGDNLMDIIDKRLRVYITEKQYNERLNNAKDIMKNINVPSLIKDEFLNASDKSMLNIINSIIRTMIDIKIQRNVSDDESTNITYSFEVDGYKGTEE